MFSWSLTWSLIGFVFGYGAGAITMRLIPPVKDHKTAWMRTIGVIFMVAALVTVVQGVSFQIQQRAVLDCQAQYNKEVAEAIKARADLQDLDRSNIVMMAEEVITADGREEVNAALAAYIKRQTAIDKARDQFQIPQYPDDCEVQS